MEERTQETTKSTLQAEAAELGEAIGDLLPFAGADTADLHARLQQHRPADVAAQQIEGPPGRRHRPAGVFPHPEAHQNQQQRQQWQQQQQYDQRDAVAWFGQEHEQETLSPFPLYLLCFVLLFIPFACFHPISVFISEGLVSRGSTLGFSPKAFGFQL